MVHGGTTPTGGHGFNHERLHPQLSYDYQAPVGEYGDLRASYRYLKLLHLLAKAYGESLCDTGTILPDNAGSIEPEDTETIRYCVRAQDGAGFLFVNNFQDHVEMRDHEGVVFEVNTPDGRLRIPGIGGLDIKRDACFILPINQLLAGAWLVYATAQPLTILQVGDTPHYFYFVPDGLEAEFCFKRNTLKRVSGDLVQHSAPGRIHLKPRIGQEYAVEIETALGQKAKITTLTRSEAEHTWQGAAWGAERVIVSTADLMFVDCQVEARAIGISEMTWIALTWKPVSATR
jgi:beta-galactosidase